MNCDVYGMAKKVNLMKRMLESREPYSAHDGWAEPVSPALYLMQLRLPRLRISPSKRKLPVFVDAETQAQIERPVKIIHAG
jgi:hypothetical protein